MKWPKFRFPSLAVDSTWSKEDAWHFARGENTPPEAGRATRLSPLRVFLVVLLVVFVAEVSIMFALPVVVPSTVSKGRIMPSLLVVDDEPTILHAFHRAFQKSGVQILTASTGGEGVSEFERTRPDVMLLDVNLPDMSGMAPFRPNNCPN